MTFTDDDLKRLKEFGPEWELSYDKLASLLARLEAAEASLAEDREMCGKLAEALTKIGYAQGEGSPLALMKVAREAITQFKEWEKKR